MRQRKAKNLDERLENLSKYMVKDPGNMRGHWQEAFEKEQPLYLELGCGKGKFLRTQSRVHTDRNYIGIEGQSTVVLHAMERCEALRTQAPESGFFAEEEKCSCLPAEQQAADPTQVLDKASDRTSEKIEAPAREEMFSNMRFACDFIKDLTDYFEKGELAGIYLNFSDPWPKPRHAKRRLTYREYLRQYAAVLNQDSFIEIKTDNDGLFDFTLLEVAALQDILEIAVVSRDLHRDAECTDAREQASAHVDFLDCSQTEVFGTASEEDRHSALCEAAAITTEYEEKFKGLGKNINFVRLRVL